MSVIQITTHKEDAKDRLLQQYKGSATMEGTLDAFVEQIQILEDVLFQLQGQRLKIQDTEGEQLDRLGVIVGQAREGRTDAEYRVRILARIIQNIAEGEVEPMILLTQLLVGATLTYINGEGGGVVVGINLTTLTEAQIENLYRNLQLVAPAGVRVDWLYCFDPDEPFAFDGNLPGLGFSSLASPGDGGMFGMTHPRLTSKFAFAGSAIPGDGGFGALGDPFIGGVFVGL
jgi:hypothetical protein